MGAEAKNLEAIVKAIDQHDRTCEYPAVAVRMNPFEVERLGWDTIRGLPIHSDDNIGTGRFEVVCGGDETPGLEAEETVEAVAEQEMVIPLEPTRGGAQPERCRRSAGPIVDRPSTARMALRGAADPAAPRARSST